MDGDPRVILQLHRTPFWLCDPTAIVEYPGRQKSAVWANFSKAILCISPQLDVTRRNAGVSKPAT